MPVQVKAVPSDAIRSSFISIEVYWAITAGGFIDKPEEHEWITLYESQDIELYDFSPGVFLHLKINSTVLFTFENYVELSSKIDYGAVSFSSNRSGEPDGTLNTGFWTDSWKEWGNDFSFVLCVNTTDGDYYYNYRMFQIHFIEEPTSTTTTTTTTSTTTSTSSTTTSYTDDDDETTSITNTGFTMTTQQSIAFIVLLVLIGIAIGLSKFYKREEQPTPSIVSEGPPKTIPSDAKVLIVCPYCGARNEQGVLKCHNCQADV
jgi:hypothetical protein